MAWACGCTSILDGRGGWGVHPKRHSPVSEPSLDSFVSDLSQRRRVENHRADERALGWTKGWGFQA